MSAVLTRRELLSSTAAGAVMVAAAPLVGACGGTRDALTRCGRWPESQGPKLLGDLEAQVLTYASLAPSTHNTQPWRVRVVNPHHWVLMADLGRRLPVVDPDDRELRLSLGAFLENLALSAGALGLAPTVVLSPNWPEVAEIQLESGTRKEYPLARLERRRTLRKNYSQELLESSSLHQLLTAAGDATFYARESPTGRRLADVTLAAYRQQTSNDDAQNELAHWVRFSSRDEEKMCDGLTPATMEIEGIVGWYVRHFWDPSEVMNRSFRNGGVESTVEQLGEGAGFIVLTSKSDHPDDVLDAGQRFQRMALLFREMNIAGQPMSQALEEKGWREQVAAAVELSGSPQFIIRVGRLDHYDEPVSRRRPVAAFTFASRS
jgi:hypothetical protein